MRQRLLILCICEKRARRGESVGYRCYRMVYHLENGETIKDIKEFCYRDRGKVLERVAHRVMDNRSDGN